MNTVTISKSNDLDLKKKQKQLINKIQIQNVKLYQLNSELEFITKQLQQKCGHEWVTELQMYEKDVYCSICGITDWEKSKF